MENITAPDKMSKYTDALCQPCKDMIVEEMAKLNQLHNSTSRLDRAKAKAKTAQLTMTLHKRLCADCRQKIIGIMKS